MTETTLRTATTLVTMLALSAAINTFAPPPRAGAAAPACNRSGSVPGEISKRAIGAAVRCLINERRDARGLPALAASSELARAADRHNRRMMRGRCFSHRCQGESVLDERVRRTGYLDGATDWAVGEVLAWGLKARGAPAAVVGSWMGSDGHRAVILHPRLRHVGIASTRRSPFGHAQAGTYTAVLGMRRG